MHEKYDECKIGSGDVFCTNKIRDVYEKLEQEKLLAWKRTVWKNIKFRNAEGMRKGFIIRKVEH